MLFKFYRILAYVLLPAVIILQLVKAFRNSDYWRHWGERFGLFKTSNAPYDLMIHAVSVGEVRAIVPLLQRLSKNNEKILLTVTTPTGRDTAQTLLASLLNQKELDICYLPYDIGLCIRKFLQTVKPKKIIVVETEVWPNLIHNAKRKLIPLVYINVRLSERSFKRYLKVEKLSQLIFSQIDLFAAQGQSDASRLKKLGVKSENIVVTGSLKFDINMLASLKESAQAMRSLLANERTVWICGSTRDGEEQKLLKVYKDLKKSHSDLLLVLVPRHPERFESVAKFCESNGLNLVRRSDNPIKIDSNIDVYLGNTMGELSLLYAASDIAFVGGSVVPFGGQNILEPCALGVPVLFGPHMYNFEEISELVQSAEAGFCVANADQLQRKVSELIDNPNLRDKMGCSGVDLIAQHKGALDHVENLLA